MSLRRVAAALGGAALVVTMSAAPPASGASAATSFEYDALGDSFAAGYGVPPYYDACGRSGSAYAVLIDGRMKIELDDLAACAGATASSLGSQLGALDATTDIVSVTVGGNDVYWSTAIRACLGGSDTDCALALSYATSLITALPGVLNPVYASVSGAAPNAHVYVVGYPRIFSPEFGAYLGASAAEQRAMNAAADQLNAVIATTAAAHGFTFVDVTGRFIGHGVNSPDAWINGATFSEGALHPNRDGYTAYAAALTAAIVPARLR